MSHSGSNAVSHSGSDAVSHFGNDPVSHAGSASGRLRPVPDRAEAQASFESLRDWVRYAATRFESAGLAFGHGTDDAYHEAVWLVCWALRVDLERYGELADARVAPSERERLCDLIERRCARRQPLAYLIGEAWLCGYRFCADPRALVPRSLIAEAVVAGAIAPYLNDREPRMVLDLCAGSASIAIIAAHRWPAARVVASDCSRAALTLATQNIALHALEDRIDLACGDLFNELNQQRFDLILCNPPYVNSGAMVRLPAEFRAEPRAALDGGSDGMDAIARIVANAGRHLVSDGLLVLEIGHEAPAFEHRFAQLPHTWIAVAAGDRMLVALPAASLPA